MAEKVKAKGTSRGEIKVAEILDSVGLAYEQEYTFPDLVASSGRPLRMDFVVFDDYGNIEFVIEYQGEQHYRAVGHFRGGSGLSTQKHNDAKKARYLANKGIPLVAIPYWDYDKLDYDYIMEKANFF